MKIGICDDCREERTQIENFCTQLGYTDILLYESGESFLNANKNSPPLNLLFLDIEMRQLSGIDIKNILEISSPFTYIIFLTAHAEYIRDAFGKNVISFLRKPVTMHEIKNSLEKAAYLSKDFYPVDINAHHTLQCKDILYFHADQKYTAVYLARGVIASCEKTLGELESTLAPLGFCRIHRSYLINLRYLRTVADQTAVMADGRALPVSRRHLARLNKAYQDYFFAQI